MRFIFITLFFFYSSCIWAINFSDLNTSYWYDEDSEIHVRFNLAQQGDEIHVFIEFLADSVMVNKYRLLLQDGFEDPNHQEMDLIADTLFSSTERLVLAIHFPLSDKNVLVLHAESPKYNYYFPKELTKGGIAYPDFFVVNGEGLPVFNRYLQDTDYTIQFIEDYRPTYFAQYQEDFPAADPPMAQPMPVSMTIELDTQFTVSGSFSLDQNNFYFIQTDTLANEAISIFQGNRFYPKYRTVEELVLPLKYITRLSEYSGIINSANMKMSFDKFWITTFSSKQMARTSIRNYYRKVSHANHLFTDYKAGWKTDRGILIVVFGNPQEVYRDNTGEKWVFPEDGIEFEFRILSNLFTPELYVLIRDPKYRESWISNVRRLRGGR